MTRFSLEDDAMADVDVIAQAFRHACDDDTRNVLNVMSTQSSSSLESLHFYAVTGSWFRKAWPVLTSRSEIATENWREEIGQINNKELVDEDNLDQVTPSDEALTSGRMKMDNSLGSLDIISRQSSDIAADTQQRTSSPLVEGGNGQKTQKSAPKLRSTSEHEKDYFFLGPSAWILVREKFGFDGCTIQRSCVFAGQNQSEVAIQLLAGEYAPGKSSVIIVPPSGRFSFERSLEQPQPKPDSIEQSHDDDTRMRQEAASATVEQGPQHSPAADTTHAVSNTEGNTTAKTISRKRYATGLGNLGNTCFMNSTLQCLAHTDPLRKYFLSGEYEKELNKDNPLGTGGELASQFAGLLAEMWGVQLRRRGVLGNVPTYSSPDSAVYPRNFKYTLGKHAEQFVGYDQHDSQELATYLLDALHEDTNRVTKKPYIEKPEQGEDESDEVAAEKAWKLHLRREDSRVLENFMGQVKSRVQCCEATCDRVSTTFDPFMYLSVPVPGSTDRQLDVTFVPLEVGEEILNLSLTVSKTANIKGLLTELNEVLVSKGFRQTAIPIEDLAAVDVWRHDVYKWYKEDEEVDRIRDSDKTFIYELRSLAEADHEEKDVVDGNCSAFNDMRLRNRAFKCNLDVATLTLLNKDMGWMDALAKYVRNPTLVARILNTARSTTDDRILFHNKLEDFIDKCYASLTGEESTGQKRAREEDIEEEKSSFVVEDDKVSGLVEVSAASETFQGVGTNRDLATIEFCSNKLRQYAKRLEEEETKGTREKTSVCIQVGTDKFASRSFGPSPLEHLLFPLVVRVQSNMTVFQLREDLSRRYCFQDTENNNDSKSAEGHVNNMEMDTERDAPQAEESIGKESTPSIRDSFLQMPLMYKKKSAYSYKPQGEGNNQLGMLGNEDTMEEVSAADPDHEAELSFVADIVGHQGSVFLKLPSQAKNKFLRLVNPTRKVLEANEDSQQKVITVKDCIDKYCQKEQLEESEMWYCSKCQKHVRAWKQFHLYRLPPILIVHLKRFHYSSVTHRRDKITAFVDFPLKGLDLSDLVSHWKDGEKPMYDCYAVSNHFGGLGGGHYTAYTANSDGTWNYYDDSRVTKNVDSKEVVTEAAYVLYYRRVDLSDHDDMIQELLDDELGTTLYGSAGSGDVANDEDSMAVEGSEYDNNADSRGLSPATSMEEESIDQGENTNGVDNEREDYEPQAFPTDSSLSTDFALQ